MTRADPATTPATASRDPAPYERLIVTIDGPAGTGKSSVARVLAQRLGLEFLDTGAMYRGAAALALDAGLTVTDQAAVVEAVENAHIRFDWTTDPPTLLCDGRSLMGRIRGADVTAVVSPISGIAALRRRMVAMQRMIGDEHPRLVTEGRDQGSVVFPDADVKFYLFASPDVRARRRAEQLRASGQPADVETLKAEIIARDRSDSTRRDGPLTCPPDAVRIDTSEMTFDEVVEALEHAVMQRLEERAKKNESESMAGHA
jgi:CMP/dCMP kinase